MHVFVMFGGSLFSMIDYEGASSCISRDSGEAVGYQDHRKRAARFLERSQDFRWEAVSCRAAGRMYVDSRGTN